MKKVNSQQVKGKYWTGLKNGFQANHKLYAECSALILAVTLSIYPVRDYLVQTLKFTGMHKSRESIDKQQAAQMGYNALLQRFAYWLKQVRCKHSDWDCDTQIRVIECKKCGKRAWIRDYRSLF